MEKRTCFTTVFSDAPSDWLLNRSRGAMCDRRGSAVSEGLGCDCGCCCFLSSSAEFEGPFAPGGAATGTGAPSPSALVDSIAFVAAQHRSENTMQKAKQKLDTPCIIGGLVCTAAITLRLSCGSRERGSRVVCCGEMRPRGM